MKWVKASERLPEKEYDEYVIKKDGTMKIAIYTKDFGWEFVSNSRTALNPLSYEWLDEEVDEKVCNVTKKKCEYICVMVDCFLLSSEQKVKASVATESDSKEEDDKQNKN